MNEDESAILMSTDLKTSKGNRTMVSKLSTKITTSMQSHVLYTSTLYSSKTKVKSNFEKCRVKRIGIIYTVNVKNV